MKEVFVLNVVCGPNMDTFPQDHSNNQATYYVGYPDQSYYQYTFSPPTISNSAHCTMRNLRIDMVTTDGTDVVFDSCTQPNCNKINVVPARWNDLFNIKFKVTALYDGGF